MNPIFIIGYMGTGKTTFGKALAKRLKVDFIDLDFYITQRFRKSITELFAEHGEEGFRRIESAMLREAGEFENVVVACGGGTPCSVGNMEYMNSRGLTVLLDADNECIVRRLMLAQGKRPLIAGMSEEEVRNFITHHHALRQPFYSQAKIRFRGEKLENRSEIDESVDLFLESLGKSSNFALN